MTTSHTDAEAVDPRTHKWWIIARRGEHPDCDDCRRSPGGPNHNTEETSR